jgi:hypothetical protein
VGEKSMKNGDFTRALIIEVGNVLTNFILPSRFYPKGNNSGGTDFACGVDKP